MNATAIPVQELTCQLQDTAAGIPADTAATGLIISHGHFLHRDAFRRTITAGTSICTGQPLATIDWDTALRALETGLLPCASSEQAITCGPDPLHLAVVFGLDDTTAIRYATIARQLLETPAGQHHPASSREPGDQNR
jgi:hypothetical protein